MNFSIRFGIFLSIFLLGLNACVKREFDEPPTVDEVADLEVNTTIAELKAMHVFGQAARITDDLIIRGVVVSDDQAGNFFKVLILQDETAGIELQIDRVALHDDYPVGREVYVKLKDLFMGDNNGTIQIGAAIDAVNNNRVTRIPDNLRRLYLFRGKRNQDASPRLATINTLTSDRVSTLVKLEGLQFINADVGQTLADVTNQFSRNLTLEDCDGNRILLRTSGFADFAAFMAPGGNGSITAVYSVFGTDRQLFVRDENDIQFEGDRCGSGPIDGNLISIADLRELYTGSTMNLPADIKIRGVVISDLSNSNITSRNLVIQEPSGAGITIRFDSNNTFALGDELEINVSGAEISVFQGLLQLTNIPNNRANRIGSGVVQPRVRTIAEVLSEFSSLESTLVTINDVEISRATGSTFSGSCTLEDGTGSIVLFTQSYSAFADNPFPTGKLNLTGIVSIGGGQQTRQISIRNLNDLDGGNGGGGDDVTTINQNFNNVPDNAALNLPGWSNIAQVGSRVWLGRIFSGNGYVQATSFNSQDPVNVMWLITPEITIDQPKELEFQSAVNFWVHDAVEVLVSTNYTGNNLTTANWTPLTARLAGQGDTPQEFYSSGAIDLSAFTGKMHIAFKYTGNNSNSTTTFRVDNVVVRNK